MTKTKDQINTSIVILFPGGGRSYPMGRISSVFKTDKTEVGSKYSVSEWWLEPNTKGPGIHSHPEDDLFYIIEGVMSVYVDDRWIDAPQGSFILIPGEIEHDFENRTDSKAGLLNFKIPGDFEEEMPAIAQWFEENPPQNAR